MVVGKVLILRAPCRAFACLLRNTLHYRHAIRNSSDTYPCNYVRVVMQRTWHTEIYFYHLSEKVLSEYI